MKKYAIYLPDSPITNDDEILKIFNYHYISIYTSKILFNKKIYNSEKDMLIRDIKNKQICCLIIYKKNFFSVRELDEIVSISKQYNCKIIYI